MIFQNIHLCSTAKIRSPILTIVIFRNPWIGGGQKVGVFSSCWVDGSISIIAVSVDWNTISSISNHRTHISISSVRITSNVSMVVVLVIRRTMTIATVQSNTFIVQSHVSVSTGQIIVEGSPVVANPM